jgi:hypothetical protein
VGDGSMACMMAHQPSRRIDISYSLLWVFELIHLSYGLANMRILLTSELDHVRIWLLVGPDARHSKMTMQIDNN